MTKFFVNIFLCLLQLYWIFHPNLFFLHTKPRFHSPTLIYNSNRVKRVEQVNIDVYNINFIFHSCISIYISKFANKYIFILVEKKRLFLQSICARKFEIVFSNLSLKLFLWTCDIVFCKVEAVIFLSIVVYASRVC